MEIEMRRHSWEQIHEMVENLKKMDIASYATASVQDIYNLAPTLWVHLLNADPQDTQLMWSIYKDFARDIEDLKDWMTENGYNCDGEMRDMKLLHKNDFLKQYPSELQSDAESVYKSMREIIDSGNTSDAVKHLFDYRSIESVIEGIHIPALFLEVDVTGRDPRSNQPYLIELKTPEADHPNFWLSVILGGMFSSFRDGKIARRCAAEDCGMYFIPIPRGRGQRYHSQKCQNRDYMRKWRSRS
jgi:hypothetical protein